MVFHVKPLLLGQNLVAKKAVKMEAYVSPTMRDVKERNAGFKEKVFMVVPKSIQKDEHARWNGKLSTKNSVSWYVLHQSFMLAMVMF
ncbi:hypothetical protein SLEP1_g17143 [Rubroshorea leprosula]|uniref:Uncharacterized protein n=1 Tax=Rubroshorea leprosula TaxID=152421 RepID=A0AAV5IZ51_9ROSI|nr:hypothetical protein SLEP1_g17143 [Rubroshorea leprosula]